MNELSERDLDNYITGHGGEDSAPGDDDEYLTLTFGEVVELLGLLQSFQEGLDVVEAFDGVTEHEITCRVVRVTEAENG